MSDTPRTAKILTDIFDRDGSLGPHNASENLVNLSCQLERELNAANSQIGLLIAGSKQQERQIEFLNGRVKELEAVVNDPEALWANWLRGTVKLPAGIGDVRQYQDRIHRLVENGDKAIENLYYQNRVKMWKDIKAKEGL